MFDYNNYYYDQVTSSSQQTQAQAREARKDLINICEMNFPRDDED